MENKLMDMNSMSRKLSRRKKEQWKRPRKCSDTRTPRRDATFM